MKLYYCIVGTMLVVSFGLLMTGVALDRKFTPNARIKFEDCGLANMLGMWAIVSCIGLIGGIIFQFICFLVQP